MKNLRTIVIAVVIGMVAMYAFGKYSDGGSDTIVTINSIKKIAELATIEYNGTVYNIYTKPKEGIIEKLDIKGIEIIKPTRLLVLVSGKVKGSVDMKKARMDVDKENRKVTLNFDKGAIKISNVEVDPKKTESYDLKNTNVFHKLNNKDRNKAQRDAFDSLRDAAIKDGIEKKTRAEATVVLSNFLAELGYQSTIKFN